MHIRDFNLKFTSISEQGSLFRALRDLSLADDFKSMFSGDGDVVNSDWIGWPPAGVDALCEA
jgi:hypothetical protein